MSALDYGNVLKTIGEYSFNNPIINDNERQKRYLGYKDIFEEVDLTSIFLHAMDRQDVEENSRV